MAMEIRQLPVELNDDDFRVRASELAMSNRKREETEAIKKAANARFKTELDELDEKISALATVVKDRCEYRPVECEWVEDFTDFMMRLRRLDNGAEVGSRPMTHNERQTKMFPVDVARANATAEEDELDLPLEEPAVETAEARGAAE